MLLSRSAPKPLPHGLHEPLCGVARDAQRPQRIIEKKEPGGERKKLAFGRRGHQETNGEISELSGRRLKQAKQEEVFRGHLEIRSRRNTRARWGWCEAQGRVKRCLEEGGTNGEAGLDCRLPAQALGFFVYLFPVDRPPAAQAVKVRIPGESKPGVLGSMHREVEKLPLRA